MKKSVSIVIFIILAMTSLTLFALPGCKNISSEGQHILLKAESINYISITHSKTTERVIEIKEKNNIDSLINIIINGAKKTKKESVSDQPVNTLEYYTFCFYSKDDGDTTPTVIYFYCSYENYYMEVPYSGIWELSKQDYNNCISFYK